MIIFKEVWNNLEFFRLDVNDLIVGYIKVVKI
jgi:hypothetical protein